MTLRPQFSLCIASGDNLPTAAHSAECSGGFKAEFPSFGHDQVGDLMVFQMPPHILDRIEFRCVRRQSFDHKAALGRGHIVFDQRAPVDRCAIPDDQYFSGNVALEMAQKLDNLETFDAAGMDLKIEPPEGQAADDRKAFPVEGLVQHRGLPARRPGAYPRGAGAQPAFVDKDDGSPLLPGLFFKAGHSVRCQRRIAFSSRSTARRSGRWQLKPLAPSKRQT